MAIELSDAIQETVNGALMSGRPVLVSAVTPEGEPNVSFRGSVQVDGTDELVLWVRNPEGSLAKSVGAQPKIVLTYADFSTRTFYMFNGRARLDSDEARRTAVYDGQPQPEKDRDPDKKGTAIVVDLDSVFGLGADGPFQLTR